MCLEQLLYSHQTALYTNFIREDISSGFNSNNVRVVIEDFKGYWTVILVWMKKKTDTKITLYTSY